MGGNLDQHSRSPSQVEQILATYGRVLQLIATGKPLQNVLEAIVGAVESRCPWGTGSVLLVDEDGERLRHACAPRLPESFQRAVDGMRIGSRAGSCGTAAYRGEPVIVHDVATDPLCVDFRDMASEHGIVSCWSHPVFSTDRRVLGTLALYGREPRTPEREERDFVSAIAQLTGIAVERHLADRKRRAAERRLLRQKTVLVELAKSEELAGADFMAFCRRANEAVADTLDVERVSVWLLNQERTILRCRDLYEKSLDRHSAGVDLESSNYPRYFAALERGRSVVAHDARWDLDTSEFADSYLRPQNITSLLDAPVRRGGKLVGVVCHEHVGARRVWAADEQDFAATIGDFVSLALEAGERRRAQQAFRSTQEELLRQNFQARQQIEFELERVKSEQSLQTRMATRGRIAAGVADELRTPLGNIRDAARLLRSHLSPEADEWIKQLDVIEQEAGRSSETLRDLADE